MAVLVEAWVLVLVKPVRGGVLGLLLRQDLSPHSELRR